MPVSCPNIIVILADDLGYECIGANGGKSYQTPHLDRIASTGVRFEHCYAQPNCTPTRVQMMTGMSNVRNYVDFGSLEKSQTTFGHLFRDTGYATCIAGKWQLGSKDPSLPRHFGFDEHCLWSMLGRGERYANPSLSVNGEFNTFAGKYGPDVCQEFVVDFIRRNRSKPFLVYYPMILTHGHYEATPDSKDYGQPGAQAKAANQQHFADMVAYMDKQIGNLTKELEALGLRENTLILFSGDNGTGRGATSTLEDGSEQDGEKGSTTRGGMHVPLIASWPGKMKPGTVCLDLVDMTDFLPTICEAAGVSVPKTLTLDGRSFLPQVRGEKGQPRDWIYSYWVPLRASQTKHVGTRGAVEQAFDQHFKLYSTGKFFDLDHDVEEKSPRRVADLQGDAAAAARKLQAALEQFKDARPASLSPPTVPGERNKKTK
ncbi:sulfatase-like hydrolase/transferase [Humisphaera borealis]|uniref:Sulfatase-like hydrolase/transferase n=1 Tax=Humisphaera borealis TaxID=2807512 RepID=A0A7M2WYS9_9BACT|nr:sulfatase-like hydrolase/transferase [Humisphaera borealis]